jgi:Ni/Co efflux regulator RcnB
MNRYLLSVAALALMAAPAFAQPDDHHGGGHPGGGGGHERGPAPAAAPAAPAAPQAPRGGGHEFGNRAPMGNRPAAAPAAPAAPAAQPQAMRPDRHDFNNANRAPAGPAANRPDNRSPDNNRGDRGNRADNNHGNGSFNRPTGPGRPANAPRPNFSSFRDYHRSFSAPQRFHAPSYRRPSGWYYRRWTFGEFLPPVFWGQQYWLSDWGTYDLPPPPPGATWVRYGDDALLIDRYTGEIITVEYGVFY